MNERQASRSHQKQTILIHNPPTTPPPLAPPIPIEQKFRFVVHDSALLMGVPPSLWGTQSVVHPPLLALDPSRPVLNNSMGAYVASKKFRFSFLILFSS